MNTSKLKELRQGLMIGLNEVNMPTDSATAIILMLKTEPQMLTMLDWMLKHNKENPDEDRVIRIAKLIVEQVK